MVHTLGLKNITNILDVKAREESFQCVDKIEYYKLLLKY